MGATANLLTAALDVEPGAEATTRLQVRNTGTVVDEFRFDVVGPAAPWTTVVPDVLPLFPGDEGTVTIHVAPPRLPTTPAAELPFGIKVNSREDPEGSVVEEGTVTIAAFSDVTAELVPRTSRGRRGAIHNLAVDNRGNTTLDARLSANEPNGLLRSSVVPPTISAPPGSAAFAKVRLRPVKRFLRGPSKTHPFQARVERDNADPLVLDGAMLQDPLLPSWAIKALALLVAVVIVAAVLWLALVKPQIKAAAKDQVNKRRLHLLGRGDDRTDHRLRQRSGRRWEVGHHRKRDCPLHRALRPHPRADRYRPGKSQRGPRKPDHRP
jgi:hypothetical protein